jgi:AraC-like DNA-binding protein/quercetin dioxygenase-like cupin family protein
MEVQEALINSVLSGNFLLKLFNLHVKPGKRPYREHRHPELEIALFKSGKGIYSIGNKDYLIQAGDIFLFNNTESHYITNIEQSEEMVLMNIHFEPRFIWSSGNDLFDARYLKIFFDRNENFEHRLDRNNSATETIRNLMLEMEKEFYFKPVEYDLMVKIELLMILFTLIRHFNYVNVNDDEDSASSQNYNYASIEKAIDYINQHYTDNISLDELAETANMSKSYFSTVFKKLNGISPWDYLISKRISLATELLKNTNKTVLEIALECGFNNTANFNRAFKK